MARNPVTFTIVFTNRAAVNALAEAIELVVDAAESTPWNEELKEAIPKLRYASDHISCVQAGRIS